jgi:hypothetical protein
MQEVHMRKIRISAGEISAIAILNDGPTADAVWKALPIEGRANTWGDEIYFDIPVQLDEEEGASDVVQLGDLGYWPTGHAFCIFFGLTPVSRGDEIRAASAVNIFGHIEGEATVFKGVSNGATVNVEML